MRFTQLLPLAVLSTAFVIPEEKVLNSLSLENDDASQPSFFDELTTEKDNLVEEVQDRIGKTFRCAKHRFEDIVQNVEEKVSEFGRSWEQAFDAQSWLDTADYELDLMEDGPPHHGPPHHGPPGRGRPGKGKRPHHPPHHGKPNLTVYELIAKSKYTTKLAALINEYDDLVTLLNGTTANFTVFAPTDRAFEKIPEHGPMPSKEQIKQILTYHVSPEFYPAGRVLVTRTIPTAFEAENLKEPQRLSTQISFRGLTVNFYARIVAIDIFGTNGVIHGIDSLLIPPPNVVDIVSALPGEFSTLELGLIKTGLFEALNKTELHQGGTIFAPSNYAFKKLGPRINAFLFSKYGEKYLKALLEYHVVANYTLYSDAFYKADSESSEIDAQGRIPKGIFHVDLPTALEDKSLSIDIARYGRFITIKVNGFTNVAVQDGIAADGVIQVVPNVLIPPKTPGAKGESAEDLELVDLMERLEPYVQRMEQEEEQGSWWEDLF